MPDPKKGLFDDDDESEKTEHSQPGQPQPKPPERHDDLNYEDDEATVVAPSEKKKGR